MIDAQWCTYDTSRRNGGRRRRATSAWSSKARSTRAVRRWSRCPAANRRSRFSNGWRPQRSTGSRVTIIPTDDRLVPVTDPLSNVAVIARHFLPRGAHVLPIAVEGASRLPHGRRGGRCAAGRSRMAAGSCLARRRRRRTHRIDLSRPRSRGSAGRPRDPQGGRADARSPARGSAGRARDPQPACDPVGARTLAGFFRRREACGCGARHAAPVRLSRTPIGRVLAEAEGPIDIHWSAT